MKKIAITGGIGSGKSTAIALLKAQGYPVYSCDEIYRDVIVRPAYISQIKAEFPSCVNENAIDKKALAAVIFSNPEKRKSLNQISHPFIMETLLNEMEKSSSHLVFAEVPLLFEGGFEKDFDKIIVITRKKEDRIAAIAQRDGLSKEEASARIQAQFDYDGSHAKERINALGAIVISNDEDEKRLADKIFHSIESL